MIKFFSISAISQKRHLELVNEKSDNYDSADAYGLSYQEKHLEGNGSADSSLSPNLFYILELIKYK